MAETMPMLYPHFKGKTLQLFCHLSYNLVIFIFWPIFSFLESRMSYGPKMSYNKGIWQFFPFPGKSHAATQTETGWNDEHHLIHRK
ncbi:MAG TPA: hypothetical protein H9702_08665 [Candidatus Merdibacter merdavium]|uniref:Uncharacterized protein n=1 Tax=Candidatus Merdibacter merdavium TaxID=2838692 RepID=A0A9D2NTC4_9FIRM|nr:hypothetical protein [Candidatus Merdibacter merdavium]